VKVGMDEIAEQCVYRPYDVGYVRSHSHSGVDIQGAFRRVRRRDVRKIVIRFVFGIRFKKTEPYKNLTSLEFRRFSDRNCVQSAIQIKT